MFFPYVTYIMRICMIWALNMPLAFHTWLDNLWLIWLLDSHLSTLGYLFFCGGGFLFFTFLVNKCGEIVDSYVVCHKWATC